MHAKAAETESNPVLLFTKLSAKSIRGGPYFSRWPSVAPPPFHSNLLLWPARLLWRMIQFLAVLCPAQTNGRKVHLGSDGSGQLPARREDEGTTWNH